MISLKIVKLDVERLSRRKIATPIRPAATVPTGEPSKVVLVLK